MLRAIYCEVILSSQHCTIRYGAFYFVGDDDSNYLQALLESGSPSEGSKWELAHDLRTKCYEQLVAKSSYHLDHKKHYTIWYGAFYFVGDDDSTYLQALLELGSPSEGSKWELAHDLGTKCYEQFIAKSSYQPTTYD